MSRLLESDPYGARDEAALLEELNGLTAMHQRGCPAYERIWPAQPPAQSIDQVPYLHVAVFKDVELRNSDPGIEFERDLLSSATTSGRPSRIALDRRSSQLQSRSSQRILGEFLGEELRPLLILDGARSLRRRGEVSARIAAAMSLRPFAAELQFLMPDGPEGSVDWDRVVEASSSSHSLLVYGFTWVLWAAWAAVDLPDRARDALAGKRVQFVHSGGWKKLTALQVAPSELNAALLDGLGEGSGVLDFYGLVEQVGVVYPLCAAGARHVPVWGEVLARDPHTLEILPLGAPGMLQLMNVLAYGAPYHSVLTEDLGRVLGGPCPCGRQGRRFELIGRIPGAETRGCANV